LITDGTSFPHVFQVLILNGLRTRAVSKKVTGADVKILRELERPLGGGALLTGHGRIVPTQ